MSYMNLYYIILCNENESLFFKCSLFPTTQFYITHIISKSRSRNPLISPSNFLYINLNSNTHSKFLGLVSFW